jgi:HEAT repeat protein
MAEEENSSIDELVRRCLDSSFEAEEEPGNTRSWASWEAIYEIAKRPDGEVLTSAKNLLSSRDPWLRARGANVLGQLQPGSRDSERFDSLSAAIEVEDDDRALTSLIHAISHLHDSKILSKFLEFSHNHNPEIRRAVAMSIDPNWGDTAVAALCELCSDEWAGVRDWATFKFRISSADSVEVRKCLTSRLHDPEPTVRAEAICALAHRHDLACLKQLIDDLGNLEAFDDDYCHIEAAHQLLGCGPDDERAAEDLRAELVRIYPLS